LRSVHVAAVVLILTGVAGVAPATGAASTIELSGVGIAFQAGYYPFDDPDRSRTVTATQNGEVMTFHVDDDVIGFAPPVDSVCVYPPTAPDFDTVECNMAGLRFVALVTGDGDDHVTLDGVMPGSLCGGRGNDTLTGGAGVDIISGAAGDDTLRARGGDDFLFADRMVFPDPADPSCSALPSEPAGVNDLDGGSGDDLVVGN
jgi:Ca2+-binding RTX toxin-like protein